LSKLARAAFPALLLAAACGGPRETYLTFFNGDHGLSLRYPAAWRTDQAEQDGMWYRYFLAPPSGPQNRAAVSVTLLAGPLGVSVDEYARTYLAGHAVTSTRPEERQGVPGRSWSFGSSDGATRYRLLLLTAGGRVYGLYAQGDAHAFVRYAPTLDEMWTSLALERPERYPQKQWKEFGASLRVPESWRELQHFSGGGTRLVQYASPPLALDRGKQTVHAALTVTLEPVPGGGGLAEYYEATRKKLGANFVVVNHAAFRDGYVDVMRTETSMAVSYVKRYYFVGHGQGCSLAFEAREDVFPRASRWADYIASTLELGPTAGPAK
jgi:hypothetical protein